MHATPGLLLTRYSSWAIEGMVVTGIFRRAPDPSCSYFTVANIHINNDCAYRRSVCIALLLLVRDLCLKLGAVLLPGCSDDERRISPLEAAFSFASVLWPSLGITPFWGPGGEPYGNKWSKCFGFVLFPESHNQCTIMRHGSYDVIPEAIGLKPTDQSWHYEQWLHLKTQTVSAEGTLHLLTPSAGVRDSLHLRTSVTGVTPTGSLATAATSRAHAGCMGVSVQRYGPDPDGRSAVEVMSVKHVDEVMRALVVARRSEESELDEVAV